MFSVWSKIELAFIKNEKSDGIPIHKNSVWNDFDQQ